MSTEIATELEQRLVAQINAERAAEGLPALKIEAHLNSSAQSHSEWMGETGTFSHTGEDGSSATDRIEDAGFPLTGSWQTAENIAFISVTGELDAGEADRMHEGLMESAGHRANILDPNAAYVGIGLSEGNFDNRDVVFLTQNFADTDGQVLVQEEIDGETVLQPYQNGEPVGEPQNPGGSRRRSGRSGRRRSARRSPNRFRGRMLRGYRRVWKLLTPGRHRSAPVQGRGPRQACGGARLHPRVLGRRSEAGPPRVRRGRVRPGRAGADRALGAACQGAGRSPPMMSRRTLHDTADMRVPAPAYPLQKRQWTPRETLSMSTSRMCATKCGAGAVSPYFHLFDKYI